MVRPSLHGKFELSQKPRRVLTFKIGATAGFDPGVPGTAEACCENATCVLSIVADCRGGLTHQLLGACRIFRLY